MGIDTGKKNWVVCIRTKEFEHKTTILRRMLGFCTVPKLTYSFMGYATLPVK